jgi:hypothetical protein
LDEGAPRHDIGTQLLVKAAGIQEIKVAAYLVNVNKRTPGGCAAVDEVNMALDFGNLDISWLEEDVGDPAAPGSHERGVDLLVNE